MAAYAEMVLSAVNQVEASLFKFRMLDAHNGNADDGMWHQHVWRFRHLKERMASTPDAWFHLLDGSMATFVPQELRSRTLVTVHDLIPYLCMTGQLLGERPSVPARWLVRSSLKALQKCRSICTVSQATANDCAHLLDRDDCLVIPHAIRSLPEEPSRSSEWPQPYIFHIGHNAAYKNRKGVLDVFARLQERYPHLHVILAGADPTPSLRQQAAGLRQVHFVSHPDDDILASLYRHATCFLFPSLYEGFGMPVLEAMSAGCPVICSSNGSLPEVAGDAALLTSADDLDGLAQACGQLIDSPSEREKWRTKGYEQASKFTLERMGHQLIDWYTNVCIS